MRMKISRVHLTLLLILFTAAAHAKGKRYDERGNLLSPDAAPVQAAPSENRPTVTAPGEGAAQEMPSGPSGAAPAPAAESANATEAADEETEARRQQKHPLSKVYLENGEMYLRSNRPDKAVEHFKKSQESGEDVYSREARLKGLWLRARRGEANLEAEAEGFDEKLRIQALLSVADGYQACAREQLKKPDCLRDAERLLAYAGELQPGSESGKLARLRLGLLLLETGRHEAALPHLAQTLLYENAPAKPGDAGKLPLDRAYYMLGQLYERSWYHKDAHKAQVAYRQVLKFPGSPYEGVARERLAYLERFSTGYARP